MLNARTRAPHGLVRTAFIATPLTTDLVEPDYNAYMASPEVIGAHSDGRWPIDGFTLDDNRALVAIHQADHEAGRAFTYLLMNPTRTQSLGCLYLNPLRDYLVRVGAAPETLQQFPAESAMVTFWLRQDMEHLTTDVATAVDDWLQNEWPLRRALFRALPAEHESIAAFESLDLVSVALELPEESRPYRWYRSR
ncbi:hypothetical protein [Nocardioides sp.]|uniref:hypothetical protein n=1 Tax=Nocardioides sp. TaxID=35761 RepID=UPI003D0DA874